MTSLAATNIRRIESEYFRDKEDRVRKKLPDKMPVVDVKALKSGVAELGTKEGISSSSLTLHCSSALISSIEKRSDSKPALTRATIFAIDPLIKVANLRATRVESSVPKLIEVSIAKEFKAYVDDEAK